jgi:hypothetical protein
VGRKTNAAYVDFKSITFWGEQESSLRPFFIAVKACNLASGAVFGVEATI